MPERDFDSAVPVRVRLEPLNSLNNRFKVDPLIRNRQAGAAQGSGLCTTCTCTTLLPASPAARCPVYWQHRSERHNRFGRRAPAPPAPPTT